MKKKQKKEKTQDCLPPRITVSKDQESDVTRKHDVQEECVTHDGSNQKAVVLSLMEMQRQRASIMKMQNSQANQIIAYIARAVGYNANMDEAGRKKTWVKAEKIHTAIIKDKEPPDVVIAEAVRPLCEIFMESTAKLNAKRKDIEKMQEIEVKKLPACETWCAVKGRAAGGLACIIGEAGDLSDYENPAKLWKRFGLAVLEGVRQGGLKNGSSKEAWIAHGYCKRRRSVMWTIGHSLIMCGGKDGKYYKIFADRKARDFEILKERWIAAGKDPEKYGPGHADACGQRYMEKELLKELWNEWTGQAKRDPQLKPAS